MLSSDDMRKGIARAIEKARNESGLSKSKLAGEVGVNDKTLASWEDGRSTPDLIQLAQICKATEKDISKTIFEIVYPDIFKNTDKNSDEFDMRQALAHYILTAAPEMYVRQLNYLCFGEHGSHFGSQIQLLTAHDHLPLQSKVIIGTLIKQLFKMNEMKHALVNPNDIMPDMQMLSEAIAAAENAVYSGKTHYSVAIK